MGDHGQVQCAAGQTGDGAGHRPESMQYIERLAPMLPHNGAERAQPTRPEPNVVNAGTEQLV
jgi:hypothetical protein